MSGAEGGRSGGSAPQRMDRPSYKRGGAAKKGTTVNIIMPPAAAAGPAPVAAPMPARPMPMPPPGLAGGAPPPPMGPAGGSPGAMPLPAGKPPMAHGGVVFSGIDPASAGASYLDETKLYQPQQDQPAPPPKQPFGLWPAIKYEASNIANGLYGAVMAPADVMEGRASMADPATQDRLIGFAGMLAAPGVGSDDASMLSTGATKYDGPGIKAYHGSPHSFDAFDTSKIGTGEGAQAYGHGLYFAENEAVAKSYRDALSASHTTADTDPMSLAASATNFYGGDRQTAASTLEQSLSDPSGLMDDAQKQHVQNALSILRSDAPLRSGSMYQVQVNANPDHFLDWDKPLSEQHPVVQNAFYGGRGIPESAASMPGYAALVKLGKALGEPTSSSAAAADHLRSRGVPGIKYLDQGSRAAGDGSRNYVVFDHKAIDILKKYGLAGLGLGGSTLAGAGWNNTQDVPHMARGGGLGGLSRGFGMGALGQGLPGSAAPPSAPHAMGMLPGGIQPVLSPNLQHGLLRHALKMRPHYEEGGGEGEGAGGDSAGASDGGYGSNLGSLGIGASAGVGGFGIGGFGGDVGSVSNAPVGSASNPGTGGYGIGGFGGAVGSVSSGANVGSASNPGRGDNSDSGFSGYGGLGSSTTMGRASDSVAGLGATNSGYGYSSGTSGGGYGGDIGPSGIATGGGFGAGSFGSSNTSAGGLAGFGNFGSSSLSDSDGLRGAENYGYGVGLGGDDGFGGYSSFHAGNDANFGSYGLNNTANMGATDTGITGTSDSPYGSFSHPFGLSDVSSTLADAGNLSPRQAMFGNFGAGSTSDTGLVGDTGLSNYSSPSNVPTIATSPSGLGVTSSLGSLGGFDNFGSADQQGLNPSMVSSAGYSPNARNWGAGFGSGFGSAFGAGDDAVAATGDPARALTVHAAQFGQFGADGPNQDLGHTDPATSPYGLGTNLAPGFDNFGMSDNALTDSLLSPSDAAYQPHGYTPKGEVADMVTSPGDYFGAQYPALAQYSKFNTLSPGFAAGLLGNANIESAAQDLGPLGVRPDAMNPTSYALGAFQDLGDRKTTMLSNLGINPAGMSPQQEHNALTALGIGSFTGQLGNALNEIATDKQYGATLADAMNPNVTAAQAAQDVLGNFEKPSAEDAAKTLAARVASASAFSNAFAQAKATANSDLGIGNIGSLSPADRPAAATQLGVTTAAPASVGDPTSITPASALGTTYGADVRQALTINPHGPDKKTASVGISGQSGYDSMSFDDQAKEDDKFAASRPASDIAAADALDAAIAAYKANPNDATTQLNYINASINAGVGDPLKPGNSDVTSTPSYVPGEKTVVKGLINGVVGGVPIAGAINGLSALLGGPSVGGWIADHSSPGEPANPSGGNNTHDNVTGNNTYNFVNGAPGTGSGSGSSSSGQSAAAIASSAYAQALKNLPGPNARKANPVPLVPPGASTASFYNPLTDPAVLAALRAAYA